MAASSSSWPEADLVRRLCVALKIATEELAAEGYSDPNDEEVEVGSTKIIAETAMLLLAAVPAARRFAVLREQIESVAQLLAPHARSRHMRLGLCLRPALARDYGFAHICLSALNHPDADFDGLLRSGVAAYEAESRKRPPHRELEQRWIARVWSGNFHHSRSDVQLSRGSMIGRPIDTLRAAVTIFIHSRTPCCTRLISVKPRYGFRDRSDYSGGRGSCLGSMPRLRGLRSRW